MDMAEEEAAELIIALKNYKRNRGTEDDVCEEVADMEIMCAQMRLMFGSSRVDAIKAHKLDRLHKRVYGDAPASMGVLSDG
jgi:phosphoribosyl-ATP pyrophosphohydrolase